MDCTQRPAPRVARLTASHSAENREESTGRTSTPLRRGPSNVPNRHRCGLCSEGLWWNSSHLVTPSSLSVDDQNGSCSSLTTSPRLALGFWMRSMRNVAQSALCIIGTFTMATYTRTASRYAISSAHQWATNVASLCDFLLDEILVQ